MKTQDEIVARIKAKEAAKSSMFGFDLEVLIYALDFEHAKPWLKPEAKETDWAPSTERDEAGIKKAALDYMEFAWGKAQDHRGLSAGRSIDKMTEYAWLLGHDDLVARLERDEVPYAQYGCPILKVISEAIGAPVPNDTETRRMMEGSPCVDGCENGCGT